RERTRSHHIWMVRKWKDGVMRTSKSAAVVFGTVLALGAVMTLSASHTAKRERTKIVEFTAVRGIDRASIDQSRSIEAEFAADSCVCYANGKSYSPGSKTCLGGQVMICSDRPSGSGNNCGWAPPKVDGAPERCGN